METKFLIVDGNSLAYRAAFAHNPKFGEDLSNFDGKPTGAIYRFFNMFNRILHQVQPTHIVIAWDTGGANFRKELDPEYKANRSKKSPLEQELRIHEQFNDIRDILSKIGVKNVGIPGFEGDDIVGTYVKLSEADKNFIITGDKDNFQLVSDNTTVIFPINGFKEVDFITPDYILNKYGIHQRHFIDLKALMGDDGDNIKGIDGCGEKTAIKLLEMFGSAEAVSRHMAEDTKGINKRVITGIKEWAPRYEVVMQLVTIRQDLDVPYKFCDCMTLFNWEEAREPFKELCFNNFLKKLNAGEFYGQ